MRRGHERARGFTLLELLVVVAIIGIIAAIATMNFMGAIDRARQKRTMNDIRMIATAWETRASETQSYTVAGFTFPGTTITVDDLGKALSPTYIRTMPVYDGWNRPYEFALTASLKPEYAIRSPGSDGTFEGTTYVAGEFTNPDCDIVFSTGSFITYPGSLGPK